MVKPFSIQAPEDIAKEYAGDKQRIMQAAQMGVVDPTAAVLAGMFIDRMRAPQSAGQANPPTVAQQVMAGAPPQGMQPPPQQGQQMPPAGGLGATAPQGMSPQPEMPPQEEQPMMAAGGMVPPYAAGGLDGLPVPDSMFDESRNGGFDDGYNNGGLVAFARGGSNASRMSDAEYLNYILQKESRGRDYNPDGTPVRNKRSGAMFSMQVLPSTAADPGYGVKPAASQTPEEYNRVGRELALALRGRYGDTEGAMAYNWGPGNVDRWVSGGRRGAVPTETRNYVAGLGSIPATATPLADVNPANRDERQRTSLLDSIGLAGGLMGNMPSQYRDEMQAYLESERSPEAAKKRRKDDVWEAVGQFGAALATTPGDFLTGLSGAVAKTLPEVTASAKERKAYERELLTNLMATEDMERKDAKDIIALGKDLWAADMSSEEREAALRAQITMAREGQQFEREQLERKINADLVAAGIQASSKDRDFYSSAVMAKYEMLRAANDKLPLYKPGMAPGTYKRDDRFLLDDAYADVLGARAPKAASGMPGLTGLTPQGGGATGSGEVDFNNLP